MRSRPLVVDLDGTYLLTDTLLESIIYVLFHKPSLLLGMFLSLIKGKVVLKSFLAERISIDVNSLPRRPEVVELVRTSKSAGKKIYLATAAHSVIADQLTSEFTAVFSTNSERNLRGAEKNRLLVKEFGKAGFDYVGDAFPDNEVWKNSHTAYLVGKAAKHSSWANGAVEVVRLAPNRSSLKALIRELRPHQWVKNILIFFPLIAAGLITNFPALLTVLLAFVAFCSIASATYIINDLADLENDRNHISKKMRPIASGNLTILASLLASVSLIALAAGLVVVLNSIGFASTLLIYAVLTVLYSMKLKKIAIVDAVTLGILYTLRIVAGATVLGLPATFWLLTFSLLFFFSLALMKRFSELFELLSKKKSKAIKGRGYISSDLELVSTLGVASGVGAILFLSLYLYSGPFAPLFSHFVILWTIVPIILLWISRAWLIAHRGEMNEDPVLFAVKDKFTLVVGFVFVSIFLFALTVG